MMWAFKTLIRQCFSNFSHLKEIHKKREENHEKDQNTKKNIQKWKKRIKNRNRKNYNGRKRINDNIK